MLHQWNKLGFWPHHVLAFCLVAAWAAAVKCFTAARLGGDLVQTILNSISALAIAWIFITAIYELLSATSRDRLGFDARILTATVLGALIASVVGPVFNWVIGAQPPGLDIGSHRNDILGFLSERFPRRIAGYLLSISPFWLVANWGWYAHRESIGVYSTLGQRRRPVTHAEDDMASSAEETVTSMPPAFMRKLPPEKRGVLWAITAEQHYLRIYTSAGDDLILMRFSDALDELSSVDGLQIHRSHWVSAAGFKAFSEEDKRLFVILQNDVVLPVSRPNQTAARQGFTEHDPENPQTDAAVSPIQSSTV